MEKWNVWRTTFPSWHLVRQVINAGVNASEYWTSTLLLKAGAGRSWRVNGGNKIVMDAETADISNISIDVKEKPQPLTLWVSSHYEHQIFTVVSRPNIWWGRSKLFSNLLWIRYRLSGCLLFNSVIANKRLLLHERRHSKHAERRRLHTEREV